MLVILAGATAYFNFCYVEAALPSTETLHNFLDPKSGKWPRAKYQRDGETTEDFYKRFSYKINWSRNIAIAFTVLSGLLFIYGVFRVMRAVVMLS